MMMPTRLHFGACTDGSPIFCSNGGVTLQLAESIKKVGLYKVNIGSKSPSEEEVENQSRAFRLRVQLAVTK